MRQITAALQAVQKVRSPRARVTCTVESRGQNPDVPPLIRSELVPNAGQVTFRPVSLVGLANGSMLKFQAMPTELRMYTISQPTLSGSWTGASFTVLLPFGVITLAALRVPGFNTIRLFYVRSDNNVYYIESTNNGANFGAAVTVYSGGDAVLDLVVAYINNGVTTGGPWFFGFTTQAAGHYTPRFGYFNGTSWVTTPHNVDYRCAGIDAYGQATAAHRILVQRTRTLGQSALYVIDKNGTTLSNARLLDMTQAGFFGLELSYYRFCQLPEPFCMLAVVGEGAFGAGLHQGVGGLFTSTDVLVDEPIIFPRIAGVNSQPYAALGSVGPTGQADVYLAGDTVVYRGATQYTTPATLEVVRYEYDQNIFTLEFKAIPGIVLAQLYVGQILLVNRTLSFGAQSGTEPIRAMIMRVEAASDGLTVIAVDALGFLGTARCRRPSILNNGTAPGVSQVIRKLAARFGITVQNDATSLETAAVMPMTLAPSESLAGAAFRIGSQTEFYLVPRNDGTFGLTLITPGTSSSGDYNDSHHIYGAGTTQQPVARSVDITEYRRLAFCYVLGTRTTDPQDGGALAMAAGAVEPNTRPLSYSLTNSRYNTTARVQAAAAAEAARLVKDNVTGTIEGQANLALELYDRVEVTEPLLGWNAKVFRVRRIHETYDRGLLTQIVYLGDN